MAKKGKKTGGKGSRQALIAGLKKLQDKFAKAQVSSRWKPPVGEYEAAFIGLEYSSHDEYGDALTPRFRIEDGEHVGKEFNGGFLKFDDDNMWKTKSFLMIVLGDAFDEDFASNVETAIELAKEEPLLRIEIVEGSKGRAKGKKFCNVLDRLDADEDGDAQDDDADDTDDDEDDDD